MRENTQTKNQSAGKLMQIVQSKRSEMDQTLAMTSFYWLQITPGVPLS